MAQRYFFKNFKPREFVEEFCSHLEEELLNAFPVYLELIVFVTKKENSIFHFEVSIRLEDYIFSEEIKIDATEKSLPRMWQIDTLDRLVRGIKEKVQCQFYRLVEI